MELKLYFAAYFARSVVLLIVPYGIETTLFSQTVRQQCLLIVPYGIETMTARNR